MRDQPLAVFASGERAVHMALMLRGWSDDIVVLTNGPAGFDAGQQERVAAAGVSIDDRLVAEFVSEEGELTAVAFAGGHRLPRWGVLVATSLHQRSSLAAQLGVDASPPGPVAADALEIDQFHRTSVPGVFAAGDVSAQMSQVAAAIATGSLVVVVVVVVVQSLLADDVGSPMPPWPNMKENADANA